MKFIKQSIILTISNTASYIIGLIKGILTAKLLSPENFGIWNMISLILNYSNYLDFGLNTGMLIESPSLRKNKDKINDKLLKAQTFSAIVYINLIIISLLIILYFILRYFSNIWSIYIIIIAFSIITNSLLNYFNVAVRIKSQFAIISLSNILISIFSISTFLLYYFIYSNITIEIVALSVILGNIAGILVLFYTDRSIPFSRINYNEVIRIIKIGFPVAILPILVTVFYSIDRWMVVYYFDTTLLGLYSLGAVLGLSVLVIPNSLSYIISTKQLEYKNEKLNPHDYNELVTLPIFMSSIIMAFIFGTTFLILPYFVNYFLPNYNSTLLTANILVLSKCLLFALPVANNFLVARGKKTIIYTILILSIIVKISLSIIFVKIYHDYNSIAIVTLITDLFYNVSIYIYIYIYILELPVNIYKHIVTSLFPFILTILLILILDYNINYKGSYSSIINVIIKILFYWLVFLIVLYKIFSKKIISMKQITV